MKDLTDKRLNDEFNRISKLKEECEVTMFEIRIELARRKQDEIDRLQSQLDKLQ